MGHWSRDPECTVRPLHTQQPRQRSAANTYLVLYSTLSRPSPPCLCTTRPPCTTTTRRYAHLYVSAVSCYPILLCILPCETATPSTRTHDYTIWSRGSELDADADGAGLAADAEAYASAKARRERVASVLKFEMHHSITCKPIKSKSVGELQKYVMKHTHA